MDIRREAPDFAAIAEAVAAAFDNPLIAELVARIRASELYVPELALVADDRGRVVAHTMLSYVTLDTGARVLQLSPMAVVPDRQREGIGAALIRHVLREADARGEPVVVVVGDPRYYGRFGFRPSTELGITPPSHQPDAPWQALPLGAWDGSIRGRVELPPAFEGID